MDRALFLKIFKHLVGLTSEDHKFELECVYFNLRTDGVCVVCASNGHCLAKLEFSMDYPAPGNQIFLIHKKWLQGLLTKFKGKDDSVIIYVLDGRLTFTDGTHTQELEGRKEGEYPDIDLVLRDTYGKGGANYAGSLFKKTTALIFDLMPFEKGVMAAVTQGPKAPLLITIAPLDSVVFSATFAIMPSNE
jgi:hypothetical protein